MSRSDLEGVQVTLVDSVKEATGFIDWILKQPTVAIDSETVGLDWWVPNFTRLVQFGNEQESYAVGALEWRQLICQALDIIKAKQIPVYFHNSKFDMHALEADGFPVPEWPFIHDTMILDHLCYPIRSHALKQMGSRVYGKYATVGQQMLNAYNNTNGTDWSTVPVSERAYWAYGCMDTVLTARFSHSLSTEVKERGMWLAYERESAAQAVAYGMETRGLNIDRPYTEALLAEWEHEICKVRLQLDAWNIDNPGSKADVVHALRTREGWDPEEFTETGEPLLDKGVLESLDSKIAPLVLKYKRYVKWNKTYLRHFLEQSVDDTVFPNIRTLAARTGRMSITNPPMQTLPSKEASIRNCIVADEGYALWPIDYDAQELRVMAHYSKDPGLLRMFKEGMDPHSFVASVVYGLPYEDVKAGKHKEKRDRSKNTSFARAYGAQAKRMAKTAGTPIHVIEEFLAIYDANFPGVDRFIQETEQVAQARMLTEGEPYVTSAGGRWLNTEPDKLYALVNYVIQGSCADLLKMKMVELDKAGYGDSLLLPVHDELIFQFPEGDTDSPREVAEIMTETEMFDLPLTCTPSGPFNAWGEAYA